MCPTHVIFDVPLSISLKTSRCNFDHRMSTVDKTCVSRYMQLADSGRATLGGKLANGSEATFILSLV